MKRTEKFVINTIILTASTLLMQLIAVTFNAYLSRKIGSSGIGLYQLILSVYTFGVTFATSGIKLATTRLIVASALEDNHGTSDRHSMRHCLLYSIIFGIIGAVVLFNFAEYISINWFSDVRPTLSLKILALSLPFLAMSSSLCGYFTAKRKISRFACTQIGEQLLRIIITSSILTLMLPRGLSFACAAIAIGTCISEFGACLALFILYMIDKVQQLPSAKSKSVKKSHITKKLLSIAIPDAISSYARSALITIEHLLIPGGLKKSGATADAALASYGVVQGMALPIVLFPSALLNALSNLLIPEIAEYHESKDTHKIDLIITRVLELAFMFSIGVTGILFTFSNELGIAVYSNSAASHFIKMLAPIVPIMYVDTAVDGVLKGLGQQVSSMRYNIIDASVSVILVYILLPHLAIEGYIITIFVTESLNFYLSINKLISITSFHLNLLNAIIKPIFCIIGAITLVKLILSMFFVDSCATLTAVIGITLTGIMYYVSLKLLSCIPKM